MFHGRREREAVGASVVHCLTDTKLVVNQTGAVAGSELRERGVSLARERGFAQADAWRARAEDPVWRVRGDCFQNYLGVDLPNGVRKHTRSHNAILS